MQMVSDELWTLTPSSRYILRSCYPRTARLFPHSWGKLAGRIL